MVEQVDDRKSIDRPFQTQLPAFTLQHLRYAVSAAEHGSFRRAAEALLLRQSTLSRCIRQLEKSIGMIVFERSSGGVRATHGGPTISAHRAVNSRAGGRAGGDRAQHGPGRSRAAGDRFLHVAFGRKPSRDADGSTRSAFPQIEIEMIESSRLRSRHRSSQRRCRHRDRHGRSPLPESNAMALWSERMLVATSGRSSARRKRDRLLDRP